MPKSCSQHRNSTGLSNLAVWQNLTERQRSIRTKQNEIEWGAVQKLVGYPNLLRCCQNQTTFLIVPIPWNYGNPISKPNVLQATLARPCAGQGQRRLTAARPSGSFPVLRTTPGSWTAGAAHGYRKGLPCCGDWEPVQLRIRWDPTAGRLLWCPQGLPGIGIVQRWV